ncbi:MAG: signal recognition particle protein [Deltaproteobacteria bacterium]|jgi:signal recognition particle subunit SRP54|nr:signal recognition particle protein [Deltaproteobacteria bacterium]
MFENISDKFSNVFQKIRGRGKITESDLKSSLRDVRLALLDADVNYKVVKDFIFTVNQKALGKDILKSLTPDQHIIKIVNDELTELMGGESRGLELGGRPPWPIMLVGLQGSGKTTTAGKLALYLRKQGRSPYLVPADVARPAAIIQLTKLGEDLGVPVFPSTTEMTPVDIAGKALSAAGSAGCDTVIIDTAGRLSIDQQLMSELGEIKSVTRSVEVLLVADAMTGQEAVNIANDFNKKLDITGVILSKMEGDARGGAAMSIREITGKPIKFLGTGEKSDALEVFHPERMASLILGMGDVLSLIEKAQEVIDEKEAEKLARGLAKGRFTLDDFRNQMRNMRRMGSIEAILGMIPGLGKLKQLKNATPDTAEMTKITAIIDSMTVGERLDHTIIDSGRRRRIANGSGTTVADVNLLLKNFTEVLKIFRQTSRSGGLSALAGRVMGAMAPGGPAGPGRPQGGKGGGRGRGRR